MENTDIVIDLRWLRARRRVLRDRLHRHFDKPPVKRDYAIFNDIVDELDYIRKRILKLELKRR